MPTKSGIVQLLYFLNFNVAQPVGSRRHRHDDARAQRAELIDSALHCGGGGRVAHIERRPLLPRAKRRLQRDRATRAHRAGDRRVALDEQRRVALQRRSGGRRRRLVAARLGLLDRR